MTNKILPRKSPRFARVLLSVWVGCGLLLAALGESVGATIEIPTLTPTAAIAFDPLRNKVYAASATTASLFVIDGETHAVSQAALPAIASALTLNPRENEAYLAHGGSDLCTILDGNSLTTSTESFGDARVGHAREIAVDVDLHRVFVLDPYLAIQGQADVDDRLWILDRQASSVTSVDLTNRAISMTFDPASRRIFALGLDGLTIVDTQTLTQQTLGSVTGFEDFLQKAQVVVCPLSGDIYAGTGDSVTRIDGTTLAVDIVCAASGDIGSFLVVQPVTGWVYAAGPSQNFIAVIDPDGSCMMSDLGEPPLRLFADIRTASTLALSTTGKLYNVLSGQGFLIDGNFGASTLVPSTHTGMFYASSFTQSAVLASTRYSPSISTFITTDLELISFARGAVIDPVHDEAYAIWEEGSGIPGKMYIVTPGGVEEVPISCDPIDIAVNPATRKVYIANFNDRTVTIFDAATQNSIDVPMGGRPTKVAVERLTNQVFVVFEGQDRVQVIDGTSDSLTANLTVGDKPETIAVDEARAKVFIFSENDDQLTMIDAYDLSVTSFNIGHTGENIAVNPRTGKVYLTDFVGGRVCLIDPATSTITDLPGFINPGQITIDSLRNRVFIRDEGNRIVALDGDTNAFHAIDVGIRVADIEVDIAHNRLWFTASFPPARILEVDLVTEEVLEVTNGSGYGASLRSLVANPAGLPMGQGVSTFDGVAEHDLVIAFDRRDSKRAFEVGFPSIPLTTTVGGLSDGVTLHSNPEFTISAASDTTPPGPPPTQIFYQVDTLMGDWQPAPVTGSSATVQLEGLSNGIHTLYSFAVDGSETKSQGAPQYVGRIESYSFLVNGCGDGTVGGAATPEDILLVNGSRGNVRVSTGSPITVSLATPSSGTNGKYFLYAWLSSGASAVRLDAGGNAVGCFAQPTPLHPTRGPQPFRCVRGSGIPTSVCNGVTEINGPSEYPFSLTLNQGLGQPTTLIVQAVVHDNGSDHSTGFSVTNAVRIDVE